MKAFLFVLAVTVMTAVAGPITNGNFDSNPGNPGSINPWTVNGATPGLSVTRTAPGYNMSPWSLRVTGRGAAGDGAKENILAGLSRGARYTTRFRIKLDGPAQVRCLVLFQGAGTVPPILLAETVVRTAQVGQWLLVEGTNTVDWSGTATGAQIYFAVEQLYPLGATAPAGSFPSYNLDDVFMEVDTDGDGRWDSEETTTNPLLADTDGDSMPDGWELAHGLNPLVDDGALDPDGDGFTNRQEYWANTDPQNANEYPGMPCDPLATTQTRALLRYLHTLPSLPVAHLLTGQEAAFVSQGDYTNFVQGLANAMQTATGTARWPSVLGLMCEQITDLGPLEVVTNGPVGRSYIDAGGLVVLSWTPRNPWNGKFVGDKTGVDIPNLLTPGTVANVRFIGWMDTIAAEIAQFGDDRPVVFRPFSEMNGGWDWYGHLTQADFISLWRWTRDYFVQTKGLHNMLWAYECVTSAHLPTSLSNAGFSMDYYWPGDDAVDLLGYSVYTHNWDAAFDTDAQSRLHPKAFAITEGAAEKADSLAPNDYNSRYVSQCVAKYPRSAFFVIWNSFPVWDQATQTSSHNYMAIIDNPNYVALLTDPRVANRESVFWRAASGVTTSVPSFSQVTLNWAPVAGAAGYQIEKSSDGLHGWTLAGTSSGASATIGGFAPATTAYFRVRVLYGVYDSLAIGTLPVTTWSLLQQWKNDTLGSINASDLADNDGDGLANLLEYGLGSNPLAASPMQRPVQGTSKVAAVDYLSLTFRRRPGAAGISYAVEATGDLAHGPWLPQPVQAGAAIDNGDGTETVTFRDIFPISGAACRFLRLRVGVP